MKKFFFIASFILIISCASNKGVYWCGDHPCINNKEKESYFEKTMIVEVKNFDKKKISDDSKIEKLLNQAKINEKERILNEKEQAKQIKLEDKKRKKREKDLEKQTKLDEKRIKKEKKELAKQLELEEKKRKKEIKNQIKEGKVLKKKIETKKIIKTSKKEKNILAISSPAGNVEISSKKFSDLVEKIIQRNSSRSYPEINDIPN